MAKQNYFPIARQEQAIAVVEDDVNVKGSEEFLEWRMNGPSILLCTLQYVTYSLLQKLQALGFSCMAWPNSKYEVNLTIVDMEAINDLACPQLG